MQDLLAFSTTGDQGRTAAPVSIDELAWQCLRGLVCRVVRATRLERVTSRGDKGRWRGKGFGREVVGMAAKQGRC